MLTSVAPGACISITRSENPGLPSTAEGMTWPAFACLEIAFDFEFVEVAAQKLTPKGKAMSLKDKLANIKMFEYDMTSHNGQHIGNTVGSI
jgi:hypothetical protein